MLGSLERIYGRVRQAISCGIIVLIDDAGPIQVAQVQRFGSMVRDKVPMLFHFGFSASPPIGSEVAVSSIAGDPMSSMVVATGHRASRPKNLQPGQSTVYDQAGSALKFTNDHNAAIAATGTIAMNGGTIAMTGTVDITGPVNITGVVRITGSLVVNGVTVAVP